MYYKELEGENEITYNGSRWLYVHEVSTGKNLYIHLNCDSPTDKEGKCIMCGAWGPCYNG